jgi:plasmid stability protein
MVNNTTFNLPETLVAKARAYAAAHGTTITAIIRAHLEAVTGDNATAGDLSP